MKLDIAILSKGPQLYSTQSLLRAGIRRGHRMRIIDYTRCSLLMNRSSANIIYDDQVLPHYEAIIPRIGASYTSQGAAVISHFEALNSFSTVKARALLLARNKLSSLQKLSRCGLNIPKTAYVSPGQSLQKVIEKLGGLPVVIKLQEGTHGVGVVLAHTHQAAESTIEAFQRLKGKVILQEFIHEAKGSDIRVIVVAGNIIASMERQAKEGEFRSNLHRGATAKRVKITLEEEKLVKDAVKVMGLDVAGVDLLRSARGPLIMEINASPGLEGIETVTQTDVAGQIVLFIERRVRELHNYRSNLKKWHPKK